MMRTLLLMVALLGLVLVLLAAACAANEASLGGGDADGDSDSDGDTDSDTDTGGVPIEYPEALNPFMNPNSLMTGPISPPPEEVLGDLEEEDDLDAGGLDEELDEPPEGDEDYETLL